ncbi:unnamed protein product [Paramecium pentaurelia]|uniref:Uncharacterized protein n=1 Tax=Paramecium pentaurelia TaxID=43138 RepID=A0A8S1U5Q9_9CILI|nr:unnamed protein product [Paramecium pentaurelia]
MIYLKINEKMKYQFIYSNQKKQFTIEEINKVSKIGKREYLIQKKELYYLELQIFYLKFI